MKRLLFYLVFLLLTALPLSAQTFAEPEADVQFHTAIVNNEFDASSEVLAKSLTIATVRFAPYVGLRFGEGHHLKVGVNVCQDFGTPGSALSAQMAAWYQMDRKVFTLAAGIYPRTLMKGRYSTAILSDKVRFYNALMQGLLLQWHKGASHYELALDWNGKKGEGRREQFYVMTYGHGAVNNWFSINWEGMFHHYASSDEVQGVVDDILFHPYLCADFGAPAGFQRLALEAGAMVGYQNNRIAGDLRIPVGADVVVEARKWNVGLKNEAYYGGSQAPFFREADAAGERYGANLYLRNSQWQITPDGSAGFYDKADLYWAPRVGKAVTLRLCLSAHFGYGGFLGHQEIVEAIVNLDQLRRKRPHEAAE